MFPKSGIKPNIQNIPVRTKAGRQIRAMLIELFGKPKITEIDYAEMERTVLKHLKVGDA